MSNEGVLSIAGIDPSGGAGLFADIKVFHQMGVTAFGVSTAITYQNESHINGVVWMSWEQIKAQLDALFAKYRIRYVKIGIVENLKTLAKIADYLKGQNSVSFILWDPIISSSSGYNFHDRLNSETLLEVITKLDMITPNLPEMEKLMKALSYTSVRQLYLKVNVLLKGGHSDNDLVEDILYLQNGESVRLREPRIQGCEKRGTGCAFSSAFIAACYLDNSLSESFEIAKHYVRELLKSSEEKLGKHHMVNLEKA